MTISAPWSQPSDVAQSSIVISLETLRICGICLQPFMPSVAEKLLNSLGIPLSERTWDFATVTLTASSWNVCKGKVGTITRGVMLFGGPSSKKSK
jgi:methionyl-tRNA synthetase